MKLSDEAAAQIAAEYVLGGQDPAVRRAVEHRVQRDPALATQLRRAQELAAELSASNAVPRVPDRVWLRIRAQLPAPVPKQRARQGWQRYWVWQGWAGAAIATALAVGVLPMLRHTAPTDAALLSAPAPAMTSSRPSSSNSGVALATGEGTLSSGVVLATGEASASSAIAPASSVPRAAPGQSPALVAAAPVRADDIPIAATVKRAVSVAVNGARRIDGTPAVVSSRPTVGAPAATVATSPIGATTAPTSADLPSTGTGQDSPSDQTATNDEGRSARRFTTRGLDSTAPVGAAISTLASKQGTAAWQVRLDDGQDALQVAVVAPQDPGEAHDFELWAIPDDGGAPQAIGLISGAKDVVLPLDSRTRRSMRMAQALAVSIEPVGGSPSGGPTGPVNFSGPVQRI